MRDRTDMRGATLDTWGSAMLGVHRRRGPWPLRRLLRESDGRYRRRLVAHASMAARGSESHLELLALSALPLSVGVAQVYTPFSGWAVVELSAPWWRRWTGLWRIDARAVQQALRPHVAAGVMLRVTTKGRQ